MAWYGFGDWSLVFSQLTLLATSATGIITLCGWRPGLPRWNSAAKSMLTLGGQVTGYSVVNYFSKNLDNLGRSGLVRTKDLYGYLIPFILASIGAFLASLAFRSFVVLDSSILNIAASGVIVLGTTLASSLSFPVGRSALLDVKYLLFFQRPLKSERSFDSGTGGL